MNKFKQHFISIVLCCYAVFLFSLLKTGKITKFINPRLSFLTVAALLIICTMLFFNLKETFRKSRHKVAYHYCHHDHEKFESSNIFLFTPILLSLIIAPGTLSYQITSNARLSNTTAIKTANTAKNIIAGQNKNQVQMTSNPSPITPITSALPNQTRNKIPVSPDRTIAVRDNSSLTTSNNNDNNNTALAVANNKGVNDVGGSKNQPQSASKPNPINNGTSFATNQGSNVGKNNQDQTQATPDIIINAQDKTEKFVPAGLEEYTQLEIGDDIFDDSKAPIQKMLKTQIFLRGIVLKSPLLNGDEIVLYREIITCCTADAQPLGIVIKLPGKVDLQNQEWIGVEGTIQLMPFVEKLRAIDPINPMVTPAKLFPYFTANKVYRLKEPDNLYLYP